MNRGGEKGRIGERGFTLLELMISISLIILVALVSMGAMRLGYRSSESGDARIHAQERFRTSLNAIESQIQSAVPIGWKEKEEDLEKVYFKGDLNSMQFSTNVSIWDSRRGYVTVRYRVEQDANGKKGLMAEEKTIGVAGRRDTPLFQAMDEIRFEYLTAGVAEAGSWTSQWTDPLQIPGKIMIRLAWRGRDFSTIIPVRTVRSETRPVSIPGIAPRTAGATGAK